MDTPVLTRSPGSTLTEQLAAQFGERIRQRLLAPGARLPSVRECARRHGVSPHTVVAAYDQLLAQGLVEARRQRGFFVRERMRDEAAGRAGAASASAVRSPVPEGEPAPRVAPVDATALIRGMFHGVGGRPAPGLGTLPPDWLDLPLLASALRRVLAHGDAALALQYGQPPARGAVGAPARHRRAGRGHADRHRHGRHPCAGHRLARAAGPRRCGAGGRARLGRGVRPADAAGHAAAARAARR
jgi:DNA-binding transcriptional MocR family regulator